MKKVVTLGEMMMRLSTPGFSRFTQAGNLQVSYAGSEANVASSLSILGIPSTHVTRFPDNDFGRAAVQSLQHFGVDTDSIIYGKERLGVYFFENGSMHRPPRIIYDRFDSAFSHIKPGLIDWDGVMKGAGWFHWSGITPALSQGAADVCYEAIVAARKQGAVVSGDINYRRNLWQFGKTARDVMPSLIELTDRVVGGIADFENCLNVKAQTFEEGCQKVMKACPNVKRVASTLRETISANHNKITGILWNGKEMRTSQEYDLTNIVDRIGAGDAFMAGLIYGWMNEKDDAHTIEFATAACALKHTIEGDVNVSSLEEVEAMLRGEQTGKLLR